MKKNNILFVHPIKEFSGSLKSLEEYLKILNSKFNFYFLVPYGPASERLKKYGKVINVIGLSKFDNSKLGYYRNLRWILIFRELLLLFPTFLSIYKIKKKVNKIDIIHFNEITLIPTIYLFKIFFPVPFILHCRILFKKNNYFGKIICRFLKKNINQIIAIDNDIKKSLPKNLNAKVVRNIFIRSKKEKFNRKILNNNCLNIGYVGSFLKYKGIEDLIYVFNKLRVKKYNIKLILAGNFIKKNFIFNIFNLSNNIDKNLIESEGITNMGHVNKLENFYEKIDILCFPSYLNALGRQVFEAAYFKIPSIVCLHNNFSDSFINNKTGLSFKNAGSTKDLENIIKFFYFNRMQIKKMGTNAFRLVSKNYDSKKNYLILENIYFDAIKNFTE